MRYLRHFTAGSLLACVLLAGVLVATTLLTDNPAAAGPAVGAWLVATAVAGTVAALLIHSGVYRTGPAWLRRLLPVGAVATVAAYTGMVVTGVDVWPSVTVPAVFVTAVQVGTSWPRPQLTGIGLALVGVCALLAGAGWWETVTAVAATGLCVAALMIQFWVWEIANRTAETAVLRERLRFAADLHDIQGHSLQVIALKSELAARLAETDPVRAAAEMRGVEALARDALRDTREVAQGYREVSLQTEIANAARVLAAAGVRCRTGPAAPHDLTADGERLLGLMVREATTNILRHSTAAAAEITWSRSPGRVALSIRNDAPLAGAEHGGGGLSGLAQRFASAGGRLTWRSEPHRFSLDAELPR